MIIVQSGVIDFTAKTASIPWFAVVVEEDSELHDLELEMMNLLGRIFQRINPALVVNMSETE